MFCLFIIKLVFTDVLSVIKSWLQLFKILPNHSTSTSWFLVDDFVFPFLRKSKPSKMSSFQFLSLPPKFFSSWESFPWERSSLSSLTKPASLFPLASISLTVLFLAAYTLSWSSLSEIYFLSLSPTPFHCQTWKNDLHTPIFTSSHSFTILSHSPSSSRVMGLFLSCFITSLLPPVKIHCVGLFSPLMLMLSVKLFFPLLAADSSHLGCVLAILGLSFSFWI